MGLFINQGEHPTVFKNRENLNEPNQGYFEFNHFSELVNEQKRMNDSLVHSFRNLTMLYQEQRMKQASEWQDVGEQLKALEESSRQHEEFERKCLEWLTMLDENNAKLKSVIEDEGLAKQEIMDQINTVSRTNQEIIALLEKRELSSNQITEQMQELFDMQQQMSEQMSEQKSHQTETLNRLENQEALMEKSVRQMDYIRSILYERANYLAEKIENGYNITSSFVYKMLTGSDQPLSLIMRKQKQLERENNTD